jgi:hypothetical protein
MRVHPRCEKKIPRSRTYPRRIKNNDLTMIYHRKHCLTEHVGDQLPAGRLYYMYKCRGTLQNRCAGLLRVVQVYRRSGLQKAHYDKKNPDLSITEIRVRRCGGFDTRFPAWGVRSASACSRAGSQLSLIPLPAVVPTSPAWTVVVGHGIRHTPCSSRIMRRRGGATTWSASRDAALARRGALPALSNHHVRASSP